MEDFLSQKFLDNSILAYLQVAGIIALALIIKRIISKFFAQLLYKYFGTKDKAIRKQSFLQLLIGPLENFLLVIIIIISINRLTFPALLDFSVYKISNRLLVDGIVNLALVIVFIRLCIRLVMFAALVLEEKASHTPDQTDNQLVVFFRDFFRVLLILLGLLLILKFVFNYEIGNLVTGLSIVGAALALATKESLENLIASFIIFFDKPFTTGDMVKVQSFTGQVERIGLRSTRMRTDNKTYITVPNKIMVDSILDNISLRTQRRTDLRLDLSPKTSIELVHGIIEKVKIILDKKMVETSVVFLADANGRAYSVQIEFYTSIKQSIAEYNAIREVINFELIALLKQHKVELVP